MIIEPIGHVESVCPRNLAKGNPLSQAAKRFVSLYRLLVLLNLELTEQKHEHIKRPEVVARGVVIAKQDSYGRLASMRIKQELRLSSSRGFVNRLKKLHGKREE